jgi:signal transduction histidine kinase
MKIIANLFIKSFLLCAFFFLVSVSAQKINKEQVKVAYIYNFLKHVNWPKEGEKSHFLLGVYQDKKFHDLLKKSFKKKQVKNKNISVILVTNLTQASTSDLLYIPKQFNNQLAQIANKVRGSQTLIVTDNSTDKHNAMLNMVESVGANAISFEVNKSNIVYEGLNTSAQLLLLGGTELDIAYLYRETEQAMQATRVREATLNSELANQQSKLSQTNIKLNKLNHDLQRSAQEVKKQQLAMKDLIRNERKKEHELARVLQQLNDANENYSLQTQAVSEKKQEVAIKENENLQMADLIKQNKSILQNQQQSITIQQQSLDEQDGKLAAQKETIVSQRTTITITTVLVLIIAFALILVVGLFIKNKKTTQKLSETLKHLEEAQSQRVQSEQMASLGKLIAGVAHEINTPLGIAVTSTSLIQENTENMAKKLNDKSLNQRQLQSYINIVTESSAISNKGLERVIELMHNFKEVAADQIVESVREINLATYVNEVMSTLANEMKKNQVNYSFSGDNTIRISTIPGALAQVITNLVNNSIRHGFQSGNENSYDINIKIEQNSIDEVCLTYHDNGIGMSKEVLTQVFDPFFTTKRNKGGTGLGMNIVYNVIEQKLSGHINIDSNLGEGVTCIITLPLILVA